MKIIVIGQYCWAKGDTYEGALKKAKQEGGAGSCKKHLVYEVSDDAYISEMGDICYGWDEAAPKLIKKVKK